MPSYENSVRTGQYRQVGIKEISYNRLYPRYPESAAVGLDECLSLTSHLERDHFEMRELHLGFYRYRSGTETDVPQDRP